jgi:hypothetical protein
LQMILHLFFEKNFPAACGKIKKRKLLFNRSFL